MTHILVINSFGPMGSSLLAALSEKLGFMNHPVRKLGLNRYLMGELSMQSGHMQQRILETIRVHGQSGKVGGISVMDRMENKSGNLFDTARIQDRIDHFQQQKFMDIQALYTASRQLYAAGVTYKDEPNPDNDLIIELSVDMLKYDGKTLGARYEQGFDKVSFIHLHRPFRSWIDSLSSQSFVHPDRKTRIKYLPHLRYADFARYEQQSREMPGLHLDFAELFDVPTDILLQRIANHTDIAMPDIDVKTSQYDAFGRMVSWEKGFTPFDVHQEYLRPSTLDYYERCAARPDFGGRMHHGISWLRYLTDMVRWRKRVLTD